MTSASSFLRTLLIYSICLPVAIFLGYMVAEPLTYGTLGSVGFVLFFLTVPLFLRWHHVWLISTWNFGAVLFFIPGRPELWLAMSWISLIISVVQYILNRRLKFLSVPSITRPMLFLAVVVIITAKCTGGIGLQALGGDTYGGKRYLLLLSAIAGYFALTSQPMAPRRAIICVSLFFIGAISSAVGELAPVVGSQFYFIFWLFPLSSTAYASIMNDPVIGHGMMARLSGLASAASGIICAMLARYGIQDMLSLRRISRLALFLAFIALAMLGGFRSVLILIMLTFAVVFYLEGLMRSRLLPMILLAMALGVAVLVPFVDRLPLPMQRSLSFLPFNVDPMARMSAEATTAWRIEMWKHMLPEIPSHLILGKGLGVNPAEADAAALAARGGGGDISEGSALAGDYHSGPLSVVLTFGIFGVIGFVWFLIAALKVLYQNYQFGHPAYRRLNTFLFGYFIAKTIFFFVVFGSLYSDFMTFSGLIGLSISLNGGVAKQVTVPQPKVRLEAFKFRNLPRARKPIGAL
jgi:hypothetical protein